MTLTYIFSVLSVHYDTIQVKFKWQDHRSQFTATEGEKSSATVRHLGFVLCIWFESTV